MGGIETNIDGATRVDGIWAAGEAACVSMHGANRLGSNSTAECLVWGGIAGEEIANKLKGMPEVPSLPESKVKAAAEHVDGASRSARAKRTSTSCAKSFAPPWIAKSQSSEPVKSSTRRSKRFERSKRDSVLHLSSDKSRVYNSNLFHALELENLLDLAEVTVAGAVARQESRGAHARRDFDTRNDEDWLKHTLAWRTEDKVRRLDYKPVTIDTWKPVERKY